MIVAIGGVFVLFFYDDDEEGRVPAGDPRERCVFYSICFNSRARVLRMPGTLVRAQGGFHDVSQLKFGRRYDLIDGHPGAVCRDASWHSKESEEAEAATVTS